MKAKLIFDLNNPDDAREFKRMNKSKEMANAIFEFNYNTKKDLLNSAHDFKYKEDLIQNVFHVFDRILEEHNINIDELV